MIRSREKAGPILFVTLSNIGDAIMTTPVLQTLHRMFPNAVIDIVVDRRSRALFEHCPYRGEIFEKNKRAFLRGMPRLVTRLRKKKYQLVVDLRTGILPYLVRADKKLCRHEAPRTTTHSVEYHMSVLNALEAKEAEPSCCLWTGEEEKRYANRVLGPAKGKKVLCIGPGANTAFKIWPWENYRDLINRLHEYYDTVVLLGNINDRLVADEICRGTVSQTLNLCGKTTLLQAGEILGRASLFIGNDSGLGHMAAAANVPTITLFGKGQPERYHPWGDHSLWIVGDNQQINNITVDKVLKMLVENRLLE